MAGDRCTVSQMADVIMEGLEEYAQLAADDMKKAVKKAGAQARKDIQENAPVKTGAYAKSWAAKTTKETANAMEIVVYSRNRYQLAHLDVQMQEGALVVQCAFIDISRQMQQLSEAVQSASRDPLTGLKNKRALEQEVEKALR